MGLHPNETVHELKSANMEFGIIMTLLKIMLYFIACFKNTSMFCYTRHDVAIIRFVYQQGGTKYCIS